MKVATLAFLLVLPSLLGACASSQHAQYERVARDWKYLMRAQQMVPLFPPSGDLKPGDVFVVDSTTETEFNGPSSDGYLPLDQRWTRLNSEEDLHVQRIMRVGSKISSPTPTLGEMEQYGVAFPALTFSNTDAFTVAGSLPFKAVSVGLGLSRRSVESGSVRITRGSTMGRSNEVVLDALQFWAAIPKNHLRLLDLARSQRKLLFLRVVTRVYFAEQVQVIVHASESGNASATANAPMLLSENTVMDGKIEVSSLGDESMVLNETFSPPVAIGYQAFDVPILPFVGPWVPVMTPSQAEGRQPSVAGPSRLGDAGMADNLQVAVMIRESDESERDWAGIDSRSAMRVRERVYVQGCIDPWTFSEINNAVVGLKYRLLTRLRVDAGDEETRDIYEKIISELDSFNKSAAVGMQAADLGEEAFAGYWKKQLGEVNDYPISHLTRAFAMCRALADRPWGHVVVNERYLASGVSEVLGRGNTTERRQTLVQWMDDSLRESVKY